MFLHLLVNWPQSEVAKMMMGYISLQSMEQNMNIIAIMISMSVQEYLQRQVDLFFIYKTIFTHSNKIWAWKCLT